MFSMNRQTMIMVALFVALATCFYLVNENKKNKAELASVKIMANKPAPQAPVRTQAKPTPPAKAEAEPEPDTE
jgi:preprotein translocase subunit SecG